MGDHEFTRGSSMKSFFKVALAHNFYFDTIRGFYSYS